MKKSSLDEVLVKNPLTKIDTNDLMIIFFLAIMAGFFFAWLFKNEYDPTRLIKVYLIYGILHFLLGLIILKVAVVMVIGSYLLGGVLMIFRSNHYFYE